MMRSNILSRLLPVTAAGRSIYEDLRAEDEGSLSDLEERAGMALDEENLGFRDDELGQADIFNGEESPTGSIAFQDEHLRAQKGKGKERTRDNNTRRPKSTWLAQSPRLLEDDGDDEVPQSLLIEGDVTARSTTNTTTQARQARQSKAHKGQPIIPALGPTTKETRAQWNTAQAQQRLHPEELPRTSGPPPVRPTTGLLSGSPHDKAMWRWINVVNVDRFIQDVYDYYQGSGMESILLEKALELLKAIFIAVFVAYLTQCINYKMIPTSKTLQEVVVPQCFQRLSGISNPAIWLFVLHVLLRVYWLLVDIPRLVRLKEFYEHLLGISGTDIQTISWQDVVARIMALRDANPVTVEKISPRNRKYLGSQSKERLDAHDIANRLMRKDNYLIALVNKDIVDLSLQIPFMKGRQWLTKNVMWNLELCIMEFVFNEQGHVNPLFLKDSRRRELSDGLRRRFIISGFVNVIGAPVIVVVRMIVFFLRYFNEYQKNPSAIGSRKYTPLAEWKFREFNELGHLFHKRINMSYPFASRYLEQFPKIKTVHVARFIAFISGAIVSVLAVATLLDPELFLSFEITPERTVLFYIGIFAPLWAVMNATIPDENLVFEPEYALRNVIEYTHYNPNHWNDRLHSDEVRQEFEGMYKPKIVIFFEELVSIVIMPFLFWFSLPKCSDQIIDFFREFTVHVDGVGYVCSFAVFDFKKGDDRKGPQKATDADVRDDYYATKHGKMAASYFGFLDNYILNPKTGVHGHVPPAMRQQFQPPPHFPGLMSPHLGLDMQSSRLGRSERRPGKGAHSLRSPRFPPGAAQASPMPSILLDPHHQPSASGFGMRGARRNSRSRYQSRHNIVEEPIEDENEDEVARREIVQKGSSSRDPYDSEMGGPEESRWEMSPTRGTSQTVEDENGPEAGGVLGLLYQFQKAQTDGRPAVHI